MLIAIDTATSLSGLALYDARGPQAECSWESQRNHTAQVLPQLDLLLKSIGAERGDLRAVAVALGPGSWSGLRVGLSLAKGLALAGQLALLGIGSLEALAYQHAHPELPIYPLIRLGRERFATACFLSRLTAPVRQGPYRSLSLPELCAELEQPALFCGDLDQATRAFLQQTLAERLSMPAPAANLRRPAYLAELAWQRFTTGEYDNVATLEPIYLGEAVKTAAKAP